MRAKSTIAATGPLHEPKLPDVRGIESFAGKLFHSSRWDHEHDLEGARVAVVGTGASAIQFVPMIQPEVERLTLFQRTAPWVLPKPDRPIGGLEKAALRNVPGLRWLIGTRSTARSR